jgi:hypothetical protein
VEAIRPHLDAEPGLDSWEVDLSSPQKALTVSTETVTRERLAAALARAGYVLGDELGQAPAPPPEKPVDYLPLAVLVAYLALGTLLLQARGGWSAHRAMSDFMGLFFVAFAYFKLIDLPGFSSAFGEYDLIARRLPIWGYAYPFVELGLGVAYLLAWQLTIVNAVTAIVMTVGAVGVLRALAVRRAIRCACLGSVFNLPMSWISLTEDASMAVMALAMLAMS